MHKSDKIIHVTQFLQEIQKYSKSATRSSFLKIALSKFWYACMYLIRKYVEHVYNQYTFVKSKRFWKIQKTKMLYVSIKRKNREKPKSLFDSI